MPWGRGAQAAKAVCSGRVSNAFCLIRPPGHHATNTEAMGFCFYNNVAVAAKEVLRAGAATRVLVLDWDVHHGNGTQDILVRQTPRGGQGRQGGELFLLEPLLVGFDKKKVDQ